MTSYEVEVLRRTLTDKRNIYYLPKNKPAHRVERLTREEEGMVAFLASSESEGTVHRPKPVPLHQVDLCDFAVISRLALSK